MATNDAGNQIARRHESGVGSMTRWSPWDEMSDLRRRMDEVFSRAFGYTPLSRLIPDFEFTPPVDIYSTEDKVVAFASLPGFKPEEINIEATGDQLTVTGERKSLFDDNKATTHRSGYVTGTNKFSFSETLPAEIDPNKVKATFNNGILQIEMPKTEQARTKGVKVQVTGGSSNK